MDFHDNFHKHPSPITSQIVLTAIPLQLDHPQPSDLFVTGQRPNCCDQHPFSGVGLT
jgi:hypothetical protein